MYTPSTANYYFKEMKSLAGKGPSPEAMKEVKLRCKGNPNWQTIAKELQEVKSVIAWNRPMGTVIGAKE